MEICTSGNHYLVKVHPSEKKFWHMLKAVKKLKNRKFDDANKVWRIPIEDYPSEELLALQLNLLINGRPAPQYKTKPKEPAVLNPVAALPELEIDIPLKKEMFPFQKKGTAYCLKHKRVIIGDQQGLGKTIQAIAATVAEDQWPGLVITKNSLRLNWQKEFTEWTDKRVMIFSDSIKNTWPHLFNTGFFDVGIVNYDSLHKYFVKEIKIPPGETFRLHHIFFYQWINIFKWVIVDESHYVKDIKTKRTKFTAGICKGKSNVYLLSGTPALNHPQEVYTQICILNKQGLFGKLEEFKATYCGKKNTHNLPVLNRLLNEHCYYRRIKTEVLKDLPEKTRNVILCDIDNRTEYEKAEKDFVKFLKESMHLNQADIDRKMKAEALVKIMELKKLAAYGKLAAVKEWIESMIDQDEKFVLFAFHKDIQTTLLKAIPNGVILGGFGDAATREANKEKFMTDESVPGIVCSISADAEGHTLTAASNLALIELPWHFGKCEQIEDRVHRIGTKYPVTINYFLAENTIDRKIYSLIMEKKDMHDKITGTDENITTAVVDQLINLFTQKF